MLIFGYDIVLDRLERVIHQILSLIHISEPTRP